MFRRQKTQGSRSGPPASTKVGLAALDEDCAACGPFEACSSEADIEAGEYAPAMQLNDDVHVLPLSMVRDGETRTYNLSLVLDPVQGPTLVGTVLPGQMDDIASGLAGDGVGVRDLKRMVLTHQD